MTWDISRKISTTFDSKDVGGSPERQLAEYELSRDIPVTS